MLFSGSNYLLICKAVSQRNNYLSRSRLNSSIVFNFLNALLAHLGEVPNSGITTVLILAFNPAFIPALESSNTKHLFG